MGDGRVGDSNVIRFANLKMPVCLVDSVNWIGSSMDTGRLVGMVWPPADEQSVACSCCFVSFCEYRRILYRCVDLSGLVLLMFNLTHLFCKQ